MNSMCSRTTPLLVLVLGVAAATALAQHPAEDRARAEALVKAAIARLQGPRPAQVTIAGQVLMPDGSAAAHALLYVALDNGPTNGSASALTEIKTDSAGRFHHSVAKGDTPLPDNLVLSAAVPGKAVLWRKYSVTDKTLGSLALRLDPGVTLTGQVVDLDGKPRAGIDVRIPRLGPVFGMIRIGSTSQTVPTTDFLPPAVVTGLYQTKTDAAGRFTLSGLPAMGQVHLKLGSKLMPAPGSASPIDLSGARQAGAWILVAVQPGSIALRITDRATGKPVAGIRAEVLPKVQSLLDFSALQDEDPTVQARMMGGLTSDANGAIAVPRLAPGEYRVLLVGMDRLVTVREAQTTRVDIPVRTGPLKGRVVDAAGKPVAHVPITLEESSDRRKDLFGGFIMSTGQRGTPGIATTDAQGLFEIPQFPWEAASVTLRATRVDDEAAWSGPARNIGKRLDLRLRRGALITVTGHLVDPQHKPLKTRTASLIRWQDAPRITWLATATQTTIDAHGRFRVDSLRRGEAFSLLSGSPFQGVDDGSGPGFESPRFTTSKDAGVQDLGDVVVHPLDNGQQVLQIYGIDSREQLARLAALMSPPSDASVDAARETLARYRSALESGDYDTVQRLTSHASTGWSEDRREFLAQSALRAPAVEGAQPLRFVPGLSVAYLLALGRPGASPFNFSFGAAASDLQANPDWIVLGSAGTTSVRLAGIVHREQGEWRVVSSTFLLGGGLEQLFLLDSSDGTTPNPAGFARPAPVPDAAQLDAARAIGAQYLVAWSRGDDAAQLGLTSPLSACKATTVAALRKVKSQRLDEGVCPVVDAGDLHLKPLQGLTQWESEWLAGYADKFVEITGRQPAANGSSADRKGFPGKYVERGDLIPFAYSAGGREFLMLMIKHAGGWQVLEPAVPR